jgi:hypothetical protein
MSGFACPGTRGLSGVAVATIGPVTVTVEEPQRDERVEKVVDGARVEAKPFAYLRAGHRFGAELREQLQLHRREHRLGRPETHPDLHDVGWTELRL